MILSKKYKATISILTSLWLVLFISLSVSHMGNTHHMYFPQDNVTQYISNEADQASHSLCPWAYAATMTIGSLVVADIQTEIATDNLYVSYIQNLRLANPLTLPNPRGPPSS